MNKKVTESIIIGIPMGKFMEVGKRNVEKDIELLKKLAKH